MKQHHIYKILALIICAILILMGIDYLTDGRNVWDVRSVELSNREWALFHSQDHGGGLFQLQPGTYRLAAHHYRGPNFEEYAILAESFIVDDNNQIFAITHHRSAENQMSWQFSRLGEPIEALSNSLEISYDPATGVTPFHSSYSMINSRRLTAGQEQVIAVALHTSTWLTAWEAGFFNLTEFPYYLELLDLGDPFERWSQEDLDALERGDVWFITEPEFIFFTITKLDLGQ